MPSWIKQSTARTVVLGPFVDSTDGATLETGLTISQADIRLSKNGGAYAQTNNAAGASHLESGNYGVPLDTTDTNTLGELRVSVAESGALPVWRDFMVVPANVWDSFFGADRLQVHVQEFDNDVITSSVIAANAIGSSEIADGAITAAKIATDAIDADALADGAITAATFAAGAIDATAIANGAIDAATFAAGAIDATAIANGAIDAATFAAGAIDAAAIADGAIDAATFAAGAITATVIATDAIDADALADNAITTATFAAGAINSTVAPNLDAAISTRSTVTTAQVNAEVVDTLATDTYAEPGSVPAATTSLAVKIGWLQALARNKITQTATTQTLRNDADSADVATASVADDGVTFTRGEFT